MDHIYEMFHVKKIQRSETQLSTEHVFRNKNFSADKTFYIFKLHIFS